MKLKYQPSIYVAREADEPSREFVDRVLKDSRLLPDQRDTLQQDQRQHSVFDSLIKGIWIEQAPLAVADPSEKP